MKIGIVSDIHCNAQALELAMIDMGDVDEVFCAGDMVNGFRWSNDVIDILRERGAHIVLGNHDRDFLRVRKDRNAQNGYVSPENEAFMAEADFTHEIEIGGRHIYMLHGSPFDYEIEYIFPNSERFKRLRELDTDVFIYGHTHYPIVQRVGKVLVVNPGSIGQPRDPNYPSATYAILDLSSLEGSIHRVADWDPAAALHGQRSNGPQQDVPSASARSNSALRLPADVKVPLL